MKNFRSTPTKPAILARDGKLLLAAKTGILLAVSYSVFTEFNFIYASVGAKISIPYVGGLIKTVITLFCISIIEGGGLVALAYIIDRILKKEYKQNKINLIGAFLMLVICYGFAVTTSIGGTQKISSNWVEPPTIETTTQTDSSATKANQAILKQYSSDSLLIASNFNNQILSINNQYNAKASKLQTSIDNYKRKQTRTGKSYISSINYLKGKIEGIKSDQAQKVGTVETQKGSELKTLLAERKADTKAQEQQYRNEKNTIVSSNTEKENNYKSEKENTYNSMWYGIFFTLPLLAACMLVIRNIFHTSGVNEQTQFDDYFYRESIFSKAKNYCRVVFLEKVHSFFDQKIKAVTKTEYELSTNEIYERSNNTKVINLLNVDESQMNLDDINASFPTAKNNGKTAQKDNGKAYKNINGNNGENTTTTQSVVSQKRTKSDKIKCQKKGCKKTFKPFPKSKRFCSTKCRVQHHNFELKS